MRTATLLVIASLFVLLGVAPGQGGEKKHPNIVLILADDLGYGDVGFQGGQAKTPHLDQLATRSVRLAQHYVFPMCSPTRAALLTGRYASRFGCTGATNDTVLPVGTATLASALRSLGYVTALIGKWHLGSTPEFGPHRYGFDHGYGSLAGGVSPYEHRYKKGPFERTWHRNGKLLDEKGHVTDLLTQAAVQFIEKQGERPFFLYVPYTAVHVPLDEAEKWQAANKHIEDPGKRLHAACVTHLDDGVGQILAALERKKLADNTIIIFLSDNGAHQVLDNDDPRYGRHPARRVGGSNRPLRGFKSSLYEGGIRTPALVCWAGRLRPRTHDTPIHISDWMPTLTRLAGYQSKTDLKWDGMDVWSLLTGEAKAEPRTLYWLGVGKRSTALRQGDWMLLEQKGQEPELYNLARDLSQKTNLATEYPNRVADLRRLREAQAARDHDAVFPVENK